MPPQNIPSQIKKLAFSPKIYKETEKIGAIFGLHIDQIGELDAEITDIFMGKSESKNFIEHITTRLEIDRRLADQIAQEVNKGIFQAIKNDLQTESSSNSTQIADLERIGGFDIEKEEGEGNMEKGMQTPIGSKEDLMARIEDPEPTTPTNNPELLLEDHPDMLVDHMMAGPVAAGEEKVIKKIEPPPELPGMEPADDPIQPTPIEQSLETSTDQAVPPKQPLQTPKTPQAPQKPAGPDPYREPVA